MIGTQASRELIEQALIFERHFNRFQGEIGDLYVFKRPKKPKEFWKVVEVETDFQAVTWTKGGEVPNYIKLAQTNPKPGEKPMEVWTCENKIRRIYPA